MKTEILGHDIKWWVEDESVTRLDRDTEDHIIECIEDGITSGQIVMQLFKYDEKTDTDITSETTGWWEIVNWQNIACQLYNALKHSGDNPEAREAIKRFDENW